MDNNNFMTDNTVYRENRPHIEKYNGKLQAAFVAVAAIGFAIALPAELSKFISSKSIADTFNNLSGVKDFIDSNHVQYFKNHIKGMGQAIYYTQITNFAIAETMASKGHKQRDIDNAHYKDHSFKASALVLAGGYVWEKFSSMKTGQFDNVDMAWYVAGVAVLIGCNKLANQIIKTTAPDASVNAGKQPSKPQNSLLKPETL